MAGSLGPVARAAVIDGDRSLSDFSLRLFQPVQPMLAESAADVEAALADPGEASFECTSSTERGFRCTRAAMTSRCLLGTCETCRARCPKSSRQLLPFRSVRSVLDGEAIALRADATPHPFQVTMRRFGRKLDVPAMRQTLPVVPAFFDCLLVDGGPLIDEPYSKRAAVLAERIPAELVVPRIVTAKAEEAAAFLESAIRTGHEGVMAKAVNGAYAAGRRGQAWLKVKRARTLDLVILAAEWGHGRRRGTLSNLHLGARDSDHGGFVMLGKTFKGLTDAMLAWQTSRLLSSKSPATPTRSTSARSWLWR